VRRIRASLFASFAEVCDLLNPYQYVGNSKSKNRAFNEGVGYHRTQLGESIQNVVILPEIEPWQAEQCDAKDQREKYVENFRDPVKDLRLCFTLIGKRWIVEPE
jgi:hypothetical protein